MYSCHFGNKIIRNVYRLLEAVGCFTTILCDLDLYGFFFQIMDSSIASSYYSLDEAIENGAAPVPISADKTTDVRFLIDIMDHLLGGEVFSLLPLPSVHHRCNYIFRLFSRAKISPSLKNR